MNIVFLIIMVISLILVIFASPEAAFAAMVDGGFNAILLTGKMLAIYAVWISVLKLMEQTKLDKKVAALFRPVTQKLFKGETDKAHEYIAVNLASNMLGMGSAATPAGIKAMKEMYRGSPVATKNMTMFLVINATSIQLIPATVMALMSAHGSQNSSAILIPSLVSTAVSTIFGILMVSLIKEK